MQNKHLPDLISKLSGETCWRAWDGLLPAIFFELGNSLDEKKGEYSVCIDTCPWQVFDNNKEIANSKSEPLIIKNTLSLFIGKKLVDIINSHENNSQQIIFEQNLKICTYLNSEKDGWYILLPSITVLFNQQGVSVKEKSEV